MKSKLASQFSIKGISRKVEAVGAGLFGAASELPTLIHLMLVRLKQGRVTVEIELKGIEKLTRGIERAAARIAVALIVAAFATQLAPRFMDLGTPAFITVGAMVCVIGIGWLVLLGRNK